MDPAADATADLLCRLLRGDRDAAEELLPRIYGELHRIAERQMKREGAAHTLQATALIHEAWANLAGPEAQRTWESESEFLRLASRAMRNVLVDHARKKSTLKRGEGAQQGADALDQVTSTFAEHSIDLIELDAALEELAEKDGRLARLVELRFFGGHSVPETARVLGLSVSSVEREWRRAREWFRKRFPDVEA